MIDLNCDMGELEDAAHEAALMEHITSASIACDGHAGDTRTMDRTVRLALERSIRIGAHPGYPDRANFGRVEMPMPPGEIEAAVLDQIVRLDQIVTRLGGAIVHVKPHGALYNVAVQNAQVARAISEESNRMGLRLRGAAVPSPPGGMLTEGVALGATQAPPGGQPIILFVEHLLALLK